MIDRGYDQNGYPFAPCGLLCRPNGFDKKYQRLTFCCFKQCLKLRHKAVENLNAQYDIATCPHIDKKTGFAKHMYVNKHPRLVNQMPRGSKRYNQIKKFRSASERSNSTIKEDKKIIHKPRVLNISRANILAQMAAIVLLLSRAFSFVVRTTCRIRKLLDSKGSLRLKDLLPEIPRSIIRVLQKQLE
jgi:hypothetical protein